MEVNVAFFNVKQGNYFFSVESQGSRVFHFSQYASKKCNEFYVQKTLTIIISTNERDFCWASCAGGILHVQS